MTTKDFESTRTDTYITCGVEKKTVMEEFNECISTVQRKSDQLPLLTGERRTTAIVEATNALRRAEQLLQSNRSLFSNQHEATLSRVSFDFERAKNTQSSGYNTPGYSSFSNDDEFQAKSQEQRQKLLMGVDRLEATSDRLAHTQRLAHETEEIGINVLGELNRQGDILVRANDDLDIINDNMSRGRRIVLNMTRRVITNKIVLVVVILILIGVLGLVVWLKFIR